MGPFMTYRIAGGENGMRHFMAQFGPSLKWPWTKLMDVPELTDELLEKIVTQSEVDSPGVSTTELERVRDDCLVDVLLALRTHGVGAGESLARAEGALVDRAHPRTMADGDDLSQPLGLHRARVRAEWVDYNGHAHESRYLQMFGDASDALLAYLGVDAGYRASTGSYFTAETHLSHLRAVTAGEQLEISTQVLGCDPKRLHIFHRMVDASAGDEVATAEHMYLHVDARLGPRRPRLGRGAGPGRADRGGPVGIATAGARWASHRASERRVSGPPLGFTFDFNGTLSDDEPIMYAVFAELFARLGRPLSEADYRHHLAGLSDEAIISSWMGERDDLAELVAQRVAAYRARVADGSTVSADVRAAVRLAADRVPLAVVSGRHCRRDPAGAGRRRADRRVRGGDLGRRRRPRQAASGGISAGAAAAGRRRISTRPEWWRSRTPRPGSRRQPRRG